MTAKLPSVTSETTLLDISQSSTNANDTFKIYNIEMKHMSPFYVAYLGDNMIPCILINET